MKKRFLFVALLLLAVLAFSACGGGNSTTPPADNVDTTPITPPADSGETVTTAVPTDSDNTATQTTEVQYKEPLFEIIKTGLADGFGFELLDKKPVMENGEQVMVDAVYYKETDPAKLALEAATGGKNTIIYDDIGNPSIMVRIPAFKWSDVMEGGEDTLCSAFIVDGKELDCIYISKYLNIIEDGRAYSLPARDPAHTLTIDEAREACAKKGAGWHLMTNAEWAALAHWCYTNDTMPHGNTARGKDIYESWISGVKSTEGNAASAEVWPSDRTLTGTGPDEWSHDRTSSGIFDLNGNVWDYVAGVRFVNGEIQVIPDNNSALNVDESVDSTLWRAIDIDGNLVAPGSPNTYKYDGTIPGIAERDMIGLADGGVFLSTTVTNPMYSGELTGEYGDACAYTFQPFNTVYAAPGLEPHILLKELALYPVSQDIDNGNFFIRNYGERTVARGGSWYDGRSSGMWDLYARESRSFVFPDIGFRSAYFELPGQNNGQ